MKLPDLSPRDRRALMLGGAVLLPALLVFAIALPIVRRHGAMRDRIRDERAMLAREMGLVRAFPPGEALADTTGRAALNARMFKGPDSLTMPAALARYLRARAQAQGLQLIATESRVHGAGGAAMIVEAELRATGGVRQLTRFIADVERDGRAAFSVVAIGASAEWRQDAGRPPLVLTGVVRALGEVERPAVLHPAGPIALRKAP